MNRRIPRRCFSVASQLYQQKSTKPQVGIKNASQMSSQLVEHTSKVNESLATDDALFNKTDSDGILVLRHELAGIKDNGTLIRKNNAVVLSPSYELQNAEDHMKKIPGPKLVVIDQVKKKLPIIKSQLTTGFVHFLHRFPLGPGSSFTWMKEFNLYNNLFDKYGDIVGLRGPLGADIVLLKRPEHFSIVMGEKHEEQSQSCIFESLQAFAQQNLMTAGDHSMKFMSLPEDSLTELDCVKSFKESEEHNSVSNELLKRIDEMKQLQYDIPPDFYLELCKWGLSWQQRLMFKPQNIEFLNQHHLKSSSEGGKMLSAFVEASEALRKCESGLQMWRIYNTSSWDKLNSSCNILCGAFIKQIQKAEGDMVARKGSGHSTPLQNLAEHFVNENSASLDVMLLDTLEMTLVGVNAMAFSMGFLLYHLSKAPRTQTKLHEEIWSITEDRNVNIKYDDIDKLLYIKGCVKEALRLQMPIPFTIRRLQEDITISNYLIPKNTFVVMAHENACLSKDNFEEPNRFLPERWLSKTAQNLIDPLNIQPFGNGFCSTIMKTLVERQMCLLTAKIIRNYWVFYSYDDITSNGKVLAMPSEPFRYLFEKRRN